jgi:phage protein D
MALEILEIEKARNNFYVPASSVVVSGKNVVTELYLELTSVQIDNPLVGADRFTFVINNGFDVSKNEFLPADGKTLPEFFKLGSPVEIRMGYGDRTKLDLMLIGIVTELQTSFPSSGLPQLTVSGYDYSFCLTKGTGSDNWENKKDSDAVRDIARKYNLEPKVDDTKVPQPKIVQSQESAAEFVRKLADRNGFEFFVTEKELVFRKPANDQRGKIKLKWGRGLLSFSPEIRLSEQVTEVEVHGWNIQTKKPIVGKAKRGDEPGRDANRESGAEYLQRVCKKEQSTLRIREPVFSQQEADQRAQAILKRRSEGFVGGRGETIGIPELKANVNVELDGLGKKFNTTFYVRQTTHSVDSSGYRTTFEIGDTTI